MPHQKTHLGHLFKNLGSQMPFLEIVIPRSGVGLRISIFNKCPSDSYHKANVGNTIQTLIFIHDTIIHSFFYLVV